MFGRYAYRGAILGLLLAIGYDTSARTAALEGGRHHLTFVAVILWGAGGAFAGIVIAAFVEPAGRGTAQHKALLETSPPEADRREIERLPD